MTREAFDAAVERAAAAIVAEAAAAGGRYVEAMAVQRALTERGIPFVAPRDLGHAPRNIREAAFFLAEERGLVRWTSPYRFDLVTSA